MNFLTSNIAKKVVIHLLVLGFLIVPLLTFADDPDFEGFIVCGNPGQEKAECEFSDLFVLADFLIEKLIFMIAIPLATLAIMIGGVMYAMYPANSGYKATAWKIIEAALIGIVVALIAFVLVKAIVGLFIDPAKLDLESVLP